MMQVTEFHLDSPVSELKGVGPARLQILADLGIHTVRGLMLYLPRRYRARICPVPVESLVPQCEGAIVGEVTSARGRRRGRRSVARIAVRDATGAIDVLFFNQPHVHGSFRRGQRVFFQGRVVERDGKKSLVASFWEKRAEGVTHDVLPTKIPIYELPDGIPPRLFRRLIDSHLSRLAPLLDDWREIAGLESAGLPTLASVVQSLHHPLSDEALHEARRRLAYEEFFGIVLPLVRQKKARRQREKTEHISVPPSLQEDLVAALPFVPTGAQEKAMRDVLEDMSGPAPMHRLLHGDVGSGKTAVALVALAAVVRAGCQGALLAPTELLARQHGQSARPFLSRLGVDVEVLTRSTSAEDRRRIAERLGNREALVLIGTHAILPGRVEIPTLALAVIDEQHRFGVSQRRRMREKSDDVDLLVMTATPIPRSLSMTLYGNLDITVLDELPPARKPVRTDRFGRDSLDEVIELVGEEARKGGRVYVVCPLVERIEGSDRAAAVDLRKKLMRVFGEAPAVALAHGRRKGEENREALQSFREGRCPVLVSTVVVEVGVDVPEATMMVVVDAHRFGLAALHQLRGRVGRGDAASRCLLVGGNEEDASFDRLNILVQESDGFRIAEEDLKNRGAGQMFGLRQHGLRDLVYADLVRDLDLLSLARADARSVIESGLDRELDESRPRFSGAKTPDFPEAGPG